MAELYRSFGCPKLYTTLRNAEMIKYAGNTLLATVVSFSNELAALCETIPGLDESTVMAGLHLDRRLTPVGAGAGGAPGILTYLRAGVGFGGSCLPKDVEALRALGREHGVPMALLEAVEAVNRDRPRRVVKLLGNALSGLAGKTVALLGLAFKPGTDDVRDSPALALATALLAEGAAVRAYDPMVRRVAGFAGTLSVCARIEDALAEADAALIATAWPEFRKLDWGRLAGAMRRPLLLDGRDALAGVTLPASVTRLRIGVGT
jgi:UDPglucose 6-dehydrogenase/GDP-mannose 6-dehydrogenase